MYTKDATSILAGSIVMQAQGNSLDDLAGIINLNNISYINPKNKYYFDSASVTSSFDNQNIRTVSFNSANIIDGQVVGKYQTEQIKKIVENAVGSLYANYSAHKLSKNQFLDFDFTIYNTGVSVLTSVTTLDDF